MVEHDRTNDRKTGKSRSRKVFTSVVNGETVRATTNYVTRSGKNARKERREGRMECLELPEVRVP